MLTRTQREDYRESGYLVIERLVSEDVIENVRAEAEAMVAASAAIVENDEFYDLEDSHTRTEPRVRRIKTPHRCMPTADALMRDTAIVDVLCELIGPGVRFQTSKLNMKSASFGAPVEWHQDWAFYPHTNDDLLAVGVMLDDMTPDNGPLLVIPGSHRGPVHDHHVDGYFCGAMDPKNCDVDFSRAVALTGPAGSVSFHHVRAIHGSAMNHSDSQRRLLLYQYTAIDAWPLVAFDDDIEAYDELIVAGEPTLSPRLEPVPVRLPLPPARNQGSIYENQREAAHRYFDSRAAEAVEGRNALLL